MKWLKFHLKERKVIKNQVKDNDTTTRKNPIRKT